MNFKTKEDAEFHAACSPVVILTLLADLEWMEGAVRKYGVHTPNCKWDMRASPQTGCTCGLDAALIPEAPHA